MIDKGDHLEFIIRSNYPNYLLLSAGLENTGEGDDPARHLPGYLPPEVEYRGHDGMSYTLKITYHDLILLSRKNANAGVNYLMKLIGSREGCGKSQAYIRRAHAALRERLSGKIHMTLTEDEYVVPGVTRHTYTDDLVSHKGVMLLSLLNEGYPVPDFAVLTSRVYLVNELNKKSHCLREVIGNLEKLTGLTFGSEKAPLIFAMRSAMPQYIPGLMPTYLNVGVTQTSLKGLRKIHGKAASDKILLNNLKTISHLLYGESDLRKINRLPNGGAAEDTAGEIRYLRRKIRAKDARLLDDPFYQVEFFVDEVYRFYERNEELLFTFSRGKKSYPAILFQKMVWTVGDDRNSYPGVLYSRHSRTGLGIQIESVKNIFGEEIMTGIIDPEDSEFFSREEMKEQFPAIYHFYPLLDKLEKKLLSPATIEFAAEGSGNTACFAVLQLNTSELTGRSTLLSAIDLYRKGAISKQRVIELVQPYHLRQIFSERIDQTQSHPLTFFSYGISILPRSAVSARLYFSATNALEAKKRGEKVCFCKDRFLPADRIVMGEVDAILSLHPAAIHVATACRGYGIPSFLNLKSYRVRLEGDRLINDKGLVIDEGEWITISSKHKMIFKGKARFSPARFQKYLEGDRFSLEPKEAIVFKNLADAYREYQSIVKTIEHGEIFNLTDLTKLIRHDLQDEPEVARVFINNWFDRNFDYYLEQVLQSEMGSHQDQNKLYNLLTLDRRVRLMKKLIALCLESGTRGFSAGAFMLGRFICKPHPIAFWRKFDAGEVAFLLNEYILFEKYMYVLNEIGEQHIHAVQQKIVNNGLGNIILNNENAKIFMQLKLCVSDWGLIGNSIRPEYDPETRLLIELLKKPYGFFFNYHFAWSLKQLEGICDAEGVPVPEIGAV
jgi:hypothetical protein